MTTLDKLRKLEHYLSLFSLEAEPVIDNAIDKLLSREEVRLLDLMATLRAQLEGFEKRYGMQTNDFNLRFQRGELGDAMDYIEWAATNEMLVNMERQLFLLTDNACHESAH